MAIWQYCIDGSGSPILYGVATIGVESPRLQNNKYHPHTEVTVIQPSGAEPAFFGVLNSRYDTPPSGWSAI